MSIQDDIGAMEEILLEEPRLGDPRRADWLTAYRLYCSPDRIRRLLDALKEAERRPGDIAAIGLALNASSEAKLSKAIELLKGAYFVMDRRRPLQEQAMESIDALLREAGHE